MNEIEKYHFDLEGYLLVKGLLSKDETARYRAAADEFEAEFSRIVAGPISFRGQFNIEYHADKDLGVLCYENQWGGGRQLIAEDFLNASSAFDSLVLHEPIMRYVREFTSGPYRLTSSELRYRYKNNKTLSHMGGPIDPRNRYEFQAGPMLTATTSERAMRNFNLLTVRVLCALHDLPMENGPLCVVPGTHKANFFSPYGEDPSEEPGMIGLPMEAGDVLFFTENLRHGGFPNLLDTPRRTMHFMIGPRWVTSQSPAHMDSDVYVAPAAWQRYSEAQRDFLPPPASANFGVGGDSPARVVEREMRVMRQEIDRLKAENARLAGELHNAQANNHTVSGGSSPSRWFGGLFR